MTTTTSSSNPTNSEKLFDRQMLRLYVNTLRQNILPMLIYTVCLLLVTVFPTFSQGNSVDPYAPYSYSVSASELNTVNYVYAILCFIIPVLVSTMLFHYLHNRLSVDFYHSMPVSRTKLFLSRYFAGLTFLLAPLALSSLLCILCQQFLYVPLLSAATIWQEGLGNLGIWLMMYTAVFTFSCMVAVTSSNVIESLVYSAAINGAVTGIGVIFISYANTLYGIRVSADPTFMLSPYGVIARIRIIDNVYNTRSLVVSLVWLVLAILGVFACIWLYRRYHSEWAQQWGRQSIFSQIMKLLAGFLMAFILGSSVLEPVFDNRVLLTIVSALIGAPLGFLLVEGATGKGFSSLYKSAKFIPLTILVCMICPLFLATDGFGMVSKVPEAKDVKSVEINRYSDISTYARYYYDNGSYTYVSARENPVLTTPEGIELIRQLHQNALEEQDYQGLKGNNIEFTYETSHGEITRNYSFAESDLLLLLELYCQPEFLQQTQPVFFYQPEVLSSVTVSDCTTFPAGSIKQENYAQLLDAVRTDLLTMTSDRLLDYTADPAVGYLNWNIKQETTDPEIEALLKELPYDSSTLVIRSSYKTTLALLSQWGFEVESTEQLSKIDSVSILMPEYSDVSLNLGLAYSNEYYPFYIKNEDQIKWQLSDPQQIEQVVSAALPIRTSVACHPIYLNFTNESGEEVSHRLYIENSTLLSILKDVQLPYLLSSSELNDILSPLTESNWNYAHWMEQDEVFDTQTYWSVAEYARQNDLDWFSGKTPEQLNAMEQTAFYEPGEGFPLYSNYASMMD